MDKLEKQVSRLPKKDLSKGQRMAQGSTLEMNTSLALFLSLSPQKTYYSAYDFEIYISTRIRASVSIFLILQHLIDILQH